MNSFTSAFGSGGGGGGGAGLGANTFTGAQTVSVNGAASTPALSLTGSIFTGGTGTTTKPLQLIEPAGTTSTGWSTSGTVLGLNAPTGFAGNLIDAQINGSSVFRTLPNGSVISGNGSYFGQGTTNYISIGGAFAAYPGGALTFISGSSWTGIVRGARFGWGASPASAIDATLESPAAATIQVGATSASPAAQTFKGPNGSGTNITAGKICLAPGQSTGNATPAVLALQGTAAGASGATAQTLVDVLSIIRQGVVRISNIPTSSTGLSTGDIWSDAGTLKIV